MHEAILTSEGGGGGGGGCSNERTNDDQHTSNAHRRNTATSLHHGKWSSAATWMTHGSIKHRTECPEPGEQKTSKYFKD